MLRGFENKVVDSERGISIFSDAGGNVESIERYVSLTIEDEMIKAYTINSVKGGAI